MGEDGIGEEWTGLVGLGRVRQGTVSRRSIGRSQDFDSCSCWFESSRDNALMARLAMDGYVEER